MRTKYVILNFYLKLTRAQAASLKKGLYSHFRSFLSNQPWHKSIKYQRNGNLQIRIAPMGRSFHEDLSCKAYPFKLGKSLSVDTIRTEQIGCYINGFLAGLNHEP